MQPSAAPLAEGRGEWMMRSRASMCDKLIILQALSSSVSQSFACSSRAFVPLASFLGERRFKSCIQFLYHSPRSSGSDALWQSMYFSAVVSARLLMPRRVQYLYSSFGGSTTAHAAQRRSPRNEGSGAVSFIKLGQRRRVSTTQQF